MPGGGLPRQEQSLRRTHRLRAHHVDHGSGTGGGGRAVRESARLGVAVNAHGQEDDA
jgi:hypothetical protein